MKKNLIALAGMFALIVVMSVPQAVLAADNSINFGGGGGGAADASGSVLFAEYEQSLGGKLSLLGRIGTVDYSFDDGYEEEDGDGSGFDVGLRVYPAGDMKGFFFGGALGFWSSDWTFIDDKGTFFQNGGKGSSDLLRLDLEVGGRFPLGSGPVSLMPAFHLGNYFSMDESCTYTSGPYVGSCDREASFQVYGYASLLVGIQF